MHVQGSKDVALVATKTCKWFPSVTGAHSALDCQMKRQLVLLIALPASAYASDFGPAFGGLMLSLFSGFAAAAYMVLLLVLLAFRTFTTAGAVRLARIFATFILVPSAGGALLCLTEPNRLGLEGWLIILGSLALIALCFFIPQWQFKRLAI